MSFNTWDSSLTSKESDEVLLSISLDILLEAQGRILVTKVRNEEFGELSEADSQAFNECFEALQTAYALTSLPDDDYDLVRLSSYRDLSAVPVSYEDNSIALIEAIRQVSAFFSKRTDTSALDDEELTLAAFRTFCSAEEACLTVNKRWETQLRFPEPAFDSVIYLAKEKIAEVLGDLPSLSDLPLQFGPGATTNISRRRASSRNKLEAPIQCSSNMAPFLHRYLECVPAWSSLWDDGKGGIRSEVCNGKLVFVPKSVKTFRTVCVEPVLNSMFQKGYGSYIADRLRYQGIDLKDQSRNRLLARIGSLPVGCVERDELVKEHFPFCRDSRLEESFGPQINALKCDLATLDLSSASDTISVQLVAELLPVEWFDALNQVRTAYVDVKDFGPLRLQKFSSMGNGFTFPLESLIFAALSWAAIAHSVWHERKGFRFTAGKGFPTESGAFSIYGDDIIVPSDFVPEVVKVLEYCGFTVNPDKSFVEGPFRESCGADYCGGIDVRPLYQKGLLNAPSAFKAFNFFRAKSDSIWLESLMEFDDEIPDRGVADSFLSMISQELRTWGPSGAGDGHLHHENWRKAHTSARRGRNVGFGGYSYSSYVWVACVEYRKVLGDAIYPLYAAYTAEITHAWEPLMYTFCDVDTGRPLRAVTKLQGLTSRWALRDDLRTNNGFSLYQSGCLGVVTPGKIEYRLTKVYVPN